MLLSHCMVHKNAKLVALGKENLLHVHSVFQGLQVGRCASIQLPGAVMGAALRPLGSVDHGKGAQACKVAAIDANVVVVRQLDCVPSASSGGGGKKHSTSVAWRVSADPKTRFCCTFPSLSSPVVATAVIFVSDTRLVVVRNDVIYLVTLPSGASTPKQLWKVDVRQLECMTSTGKTLRSLQVHRTAVVERLLVASHAQESFVLLMRHAHTNIVDVMWVDVREQEVPGGSGPGVTPAASLTSPDTFHLVVRWTFSNMYLHGCPLTVDIDHETVFACAEDGGVHILSRMGLVRKIEMEAFAPMLPLTAVSLLEDYPNAGAYNRVGLLVAGAGSSFALLEACVPDIDASQGAMDEFRLLQATPMCALVGKGPVTVNASHVHSVEVMCQLPEPEHTVVISGHPLLGTQTLVLQVPGSPLSASMTRRVLRYMCGHAGLVFDGLQGVHSAFVSNVSMNSDARPVEMLAISGGGGGVGATISRCEEAADLVSLDSLVLDTEDEGVRLFTACPPPLLQHHGPPNLDESRRLPVLVTSRATKQSILMKLSVSRDGITATAAADSVPSRALAMDDELDDDLDDADAAAAAAAAAAAEGAAAGEEINTMPLIQLLPGSAAGAAPSIDEGRDTLLFAHIGNGAAVQVTTHSVCVVDCVTLRRRGELCPIKACRTDARRGQNRGAVFDMAEHAALAANCQHLYCNEQEASMHAQLEACEAFVAITNGKFVMVLSVNSSSGQVHYVSHYAMEEDVSALGAIRVITGVSREPPARVSMTVVLAVGCWGRDGVSLLTWHGEVERHEIDAALASPRGTKFSPRGSPRPNNISTDLKHVHDIPFELSDSGGGGGDGEYIRAYGSLRHVLLSGVTDVQPSEDKDRRREGPAGGRGLTFKPPQDLQLVLTCVNGAGDIMTAALFSGQRRHSSDTRLETAGGSLLRGNWGHEALQRYLLRGGVVDVVPLQLAPQHSPTTCAALAFLVNGTHTDHIIYCRILPSNEMVWRCDRIAAPCPGRRANFMALPRSVLSDFVPGPSSEPLLEDGAAAYPANLAQHLLLAWTDGYDTPPVGGGRQKHQQNPTFRVGAVLATARASIQSSYTLPGKVVFATLRTDMNGSAARQPTPHVFKSLRHTSFKTFTPDKTAMLLVLWRAERAWGVTKFDSSSLKPIWSLERQLTTTTSKAGNDSSFAVVSGPFPHLPGNKRPAGLATAEFGETISVWSWAEGGGVRASAIYPHGKSNPSFRALGEVVMWADRPEACEVVPVCLAFEIDGPENFNGVLVVSSVTASVVAWTRAYKDRVLERASTTIRLQETSSLDFSVRAPVVEAVLAGQCGAGPDKERAVLAVSRRGWGVDLLEYAAQNHQLSLLRTVPFSDGVLANLSLTLDPPARSVGLGLYGPAARITARLLCVDSARAHQVRQYTIDVRAAAAPSEDQVVCHTFAWHAQADTAAAAAASDGGGGDHAASERFYSTPPHKLVTTYTLEITKDGIAEVPNHYVIFDSCKVRAI